MRRILKCTVSFMLAMVIMLSALPLSIIALEFKSSDNVKNYSEPSLKISAGTYDGLVAAIGQANSSGGAVVTLTDDITVTAGFPNITSEIVIKGAYVLLRDTSFKGSFFNVSAGGSLTLDGGIVIDGNNEWALKETEYQAALQAQAEGTKVNYTGTSMITLETGAPVSTARMFNISGTLNMNAVTVKNHVGNNTGNAGVAVVNADGIWNLNAGAKLIHNATGSSGSVAYLSAGSEFNINDGALISDNYFAINGGVIINRGGIMTMNGGKIVNNRGIHSNGCAVMLYTNNATFYLKGGEISNNISLWGDGAGHACAVYVHSTGIFEMTGGIISDNLGYSYGGVRAQNSAKTVNIKGGYIVNNKNFVANGYHDIHLYSNTAPAPYASLTGGTFTQDIIEYISPDHGTAVRFDKNAAGEELIYYTITPNIAEIKGKEGKYYSISTAAEAAEDGDELIVLEDHRIYGTPETISKNITVNLNGRTVYGWTDDLTDMFNITGDVIFKNGTLDARRKTNASVFAVGESDGDSGALMIENGTYIANNSIAQVYDGHLDIEGGYFDISMDSKAHGLDCDNTAYQSGTAVIDVYGGTFKNFDPEENSAEGENTDFCADGYCTAQRSENTWEVIPGICRNMQTGKHYEKVSEGLSKANAGETVQLLVSTQEGDLQLLPETKLDINGFKLIADNVVGVSTTHVYDSTNNAANGYKANGVLRVLENLLLADDNCAIPVYSPVDGGYIFVAFLFNQGQSVSNGISKVNALATTRTMKVITLLKDGAADNDIQICIRLTVDGEKSEMFVFSEVAVKNVMNSNGGKFNLFDRMFYANFTGFEDFDIVTAEILVIAHGNVIDTHKEAIVLK